MTPDVARASYRRQLTAHGRQIIIRRGEEVGGIVATALGKITGYGPDEIVGGMVQGDQKVILLAEDLESAGFPVPPITGDYIIDGGLTLYVQSPPTARRVRDVVIAYDIVARG